MSTPFDELDATMSAAIRDAFGTTALILPRLSTQYAARADDPARAAVEVVGIFSAGPAETEIRGQARSTDFAGLTRLNQQAASFWISAATVAEIPYRVARGDAVRFPERPGEPTYAVVAPRPSDMGDIELLLAIEDPAE